MRSSHPLLMYEYCPRASNPRLDNHGLNSTEPCGAVSIICWILVAIFLLFVNVVENYVQINKQYLNWPNVCLIIVMFLSDLCQSRICKQREQYLPLCLLRKESDE